MKTSLSLLAVSLFSLSGVTTAYNYPLSNATNPVPTTTMQSDPSCAQTTRIALQPVSSLVNGASPIQMTVVVNGLGQDEEATLRVGPGKDSLEIENTLYEHLIKGIDGSSLVMNISPALEDGNSYLMIIEAPPKYFREPRGFIFRVQNAALVNPRERPMVFNLKPQRGAHWAEVVDDFSAPPKSPIPLFPVPLWRKLLPLFAVLSLLVILGLLFLVLWRVRLKLQHK